MNKTKKAVLAAVACLTVLSGAFGLAACTEKTPEHSHKWSDWSVTAANRPTDSKTGKATRTCENDGCNASEEDKEYELPALTSTDWQKGADSATCSAPGSITYSYDKDDVSVSFDVSTAVNADAHSYGDYVKTNPAGHFKVCANSPAHRTQIEAHNTAGADGSCSVCGYLETPVELKQEVTVSGATAASPKLYVINVEGEEYELLVNGNAVDTNVSTDISISAFDGSSLDEIKTGANRTLNLTAGKYYIEVFKDLTFKLGLASEHVHAFDESRFEFDENKHWHPAICIHTDEKGDEANHVFGENWSEPDADGISKKSCECGYYKDINYNATQLDSSSSSFSATETGNYATTVRAEEWDGDYFAEQAKEFTLVNGDTAKKYTFKILTDNTKLNAANTKNATFSVVLEANQTYSLSFGSNYGMFDVVSKDLALTVVFRLTVEDAPATGDILRPVSVATEGETGKTSVEAGEKVYFRIESGYGETFYNQDVKLTFGAGVTVYKLGTDINNASPELIKSGGVISANYFDSYLYAVSANGGDCKVSFEKYVAPGKKGNPIPVTIGGANNSVDLSSAFEKWYKLDGLTAGTKYIIKTTSDESTIALYTDISSDYPNPVLRAESGAPLVFTASSTTVYFRATGSGEYTFTVAEFTDADKGIAAGAPLELTDGEYDVKEGTYFYSFTTEKHGIVEIVYENEEKKIQLWRYSDADFSRYVNLDRNNSSSFVINNDTSYIKIVNSVGATGKFTVRFAEYVEHDYVVTVDGLEDLTGVTVKLTYTEYSATHEITSTSNNGASYTFAGVDPSKTYSVVIEGLTADYDYYTYEMSIPSNTDAETEFVAKVYATQEYKVKVALPEGATLPAGATLEGLQVRFTLPTSGGQTGAGGRAAAARADGESLPKNVVLTDANGVATIKLLDPFTFNDGAKVASKYIVTVVVPEGHSLEGKFAYYVSEENVTVSAEERDITATPITLTALVEYTVTLKNGENNFADGTEVSVNGVVYTVGSDGTFKLSLRPEVSSVMITIDGYSISGDVAFDKEAKTITATFVEYSNSLELGVAKEFKDADSFNGVSFDLKVDESGNYSLSFGGGITYYDVYVTIECDGEPVYEEGNGYSLEANKNYTVTIFNGGWSGTVSGTVTVNKV